MSDKMTQEPNLDEINKHIADRSDVFYSQTDRNKYIDPQDIGKIWLNRHLYFNDEELFEKIGSVLTDDKLVSIIPRDPNSQTNIGSQNSTRIGLLESGDEVIIRCNPKGIKNGYFHVESTAAHIAKQAGLPSYDTKAVHDFEGGNDFAFQVIEELPGFLVQRWLEAHPEDEELMVTQMGITMANLHKIYVDGFGPFDNEQAKDGKLIGLHNTHIDALKSGLDFNLDVLTKKEVISDNQAKTINLLFDDNNPMLELSKPVLVHNDYVDWNLLTDGKKITGILDWDECVGGDPISDIACWSVFFDPERLKAFLEGYWQVAEKPENFDEKFQILRLRYVISKMTMRLQRYEWDPSDFMKARIEAGKTHLKQSFEYFKI